MGASTITGLAIVTLSEAIAVLCLVGLWRGSSRISTRLGWSVVLLVPIFGPLFFAALHKASPLHPAVPRNPSEWDHTRDYPPEHPEI